MAENAQSLRIIPLGGTGTFGMNCTVMRLGERMIVVDVGMKIPQGNFPGVDLFYPDITYIMDNAEHLEAVVLTHGHDDHIGAVGFLLSQVDVPVYGTAFTLALLRDRLKNGNGPAPVKKPELVQMMFGEVSQVGPFKITPVRVDHSIPDSAVLFIDTPLGRVVHSGDFRMPAGESLAIPDGDHESLLFLCDSTNSDRPGSTPPESEVAKALQEVVAAAPGRVFITTFASHIQRIQMVLDTAAACGRKVAFEGRRLTGNFRLASEMGYIRTPPGTVISADKIHDLPDDQVLFFTTGTQGEPFSALSRIARGEHADIEVREGDTVIFSSRVIPGNELSIGYMVDNLVRTGARIFYQDPPRVHVSGHGCRDEIVDMLNSVSPRYFIPLHGDYRMLAANVDNAVDAGLSRDDCFILEPGNVLKIDTDGAVREEPVSAGRLLVDGEMVADFTDPLLGERRRLAREGVVVVVVPAHDGSGRKTEPAVHSLGVGFDILSEELDREAARKAAEVIMAAGGKVDREELEEALAIAVRRVYRKGLGKKPKVIPVILGG
jgi:ribonuclease J